MINRMSSPFETLSSNLMSRKPLYQQLWFNDVPHQIVSYSANFPLIAERKKNASDGLTDPECIGEL